MSLIIAISGGSCSGKTTLAKLLQKRLGNNRSMIISQDDYYLDIRERVKDNKIPNFDIPEALDFNLLFENLKCLKDKKSVVLPRYDFSIHQRIASTNLTDPKDFIIVEGLLLLDNTDVRGFVDLSVYISCPQDIRFERRLTRDIKERKRTKEFVIKQFLNDVEPAHIKYIQPSSAHADLIIDQNDFINSVDQVLDTIIDCLSNIDSKKSVY
jgi:uridine kinase